MRPRLVQERVLLEKLRKHADTLVSPNPESTTESPVFTKAKLSPNLEKDVSKKEKSMSLSGATGTTSSDTTEAKSSSQKEESGLIKSQPPSPNFIKSPEPEQDSFLASVVESAKDLNIDLTVKTKSADRKPKAARPEVATVSRSHTVAISGSEKSRKSSSKSDKTSKTSDSLPRTNTYANSINSNQSADKSSNPAVLNPAQLQDWLFHHCKILCIELKMSSNKGFTKNEGNKAKGRC